jgi:SAM-dependent methyltransferase
MGPTPPEAARSTTSWNTVADAWERHADHVERMKAPAVEALLARVGPKPGDRVLELGAGTGAFAARLAGLVAPTGTVLVTDVAAAMVDVARRTAAGTRGMDFAEVDAMDTGLPDAAFDVVVFRMGLMFTPDPARAVGEIRRVLAPSGRVGLMVWAAPEHNPWLSTLGMSAMFNGVLAGGPPVGPGEVFSLGDPAVVEQLLADAGFDEVMVDAIDVEARFPDLDGYLAIAGSLAPPLAAAMAGATEDQRAAVRATAAELLAPYATDDGLVVPGRALLATGRA